MIRRKALQCQDDDRRTASKRGTNGFAAVAVIDFTSEENVVVENVTSDN